MWRPQWLGSSTGTDENQTPYAVAERRVRDLLCWETEVDALSPLVAALNNETVPGFSSEAAVCFDANAFLHLHGGRSATEMIDYFAERHAGPVIVSTQTLQELWNNHVGAMPSIAERLSSQLRSVDKIVAEIDPRYRGLGDGVDKLVDDFKTEFGHVLDPTARRELVTMLERLQAKAFRTQVNRRAFAELAALRKAAKTPPGFKDSGTGDFFVWAEFLKGLAEAQVRGHGYNVAVLVTDDVKKDWSTEGQAHPVLVAEVHALVGVPFAVMTLADLKNAIAKLV
jgi:hypothetical protein